MPQRGVGAATAIVALPILTCLPTHEFSTRPSNPSSVSIRKLGLKRRTSQLASGFSDLRAGAATWRRGLAVTFQ